MFGPWGNADETDSIRIIHRALDAGINFVDTADVYSGGESERIMGNAIEKLGWARQDYVISTKVFWGLRDAPNMRNTLNRKYLLQAIDGSLERMGLELGPRLALGLLEQRACGGYVLGDAHRARSAFFV